MVRFFIAAFNRDEDMEVLRRGVMAHVEGRNENDVCFVNNAMNADIIVFSSSMYHHPLADTMFSLAISKNVNIWVARGDGYIYQCGPAKAFCQNDKTEEEKLMDFGAAFKLMMEGCKIKRPSWGGYWYWDPEKETIMMKCRDVDSETGKDLLDIRETLRVKYTIENILADDWQLADESNCPVLGGENTFSFGEAIKYVKRGMKVQRKGWNGKGQYIELAKCISYQANSGKMVNCEHKDIGNKAIAFVGTSGVQMGWLASQADMLAEDWRFVD